MKPLLIVCLLFLIGCGGPPTDFDSLRKSTSTEPAPEVKAPVVSKRPEAPPDINELDENPTRRVVISTAAATRLR